MKDTEFVVNAFRKGMSIEEMNGFAVMIKDQYDEGFAHHEGFDAGDLAIVVMKRDVDVEACSASDSQSVAETLDRALQQANQTIEYLRNEIDSLRKMNAGQSVNINAVSSSSLAESYNDLRRRLKEVEQQIANEGNAGLRVHVASERLKAALEGLNAKPEMMTVEDAKTLANVAYNRAKHLPCEGCTQQDFEMWWIEYRKENGFATEPKAERIYNQSSQDVYAQLYVLAQEYLGWHDLDKQVSKKDSDFNKFWTRLQEIYGDGCVSPKGVDAINRGTEQGFTRADYLKLIADEIVANQGKGQPEPKPKADAITADEVLPRIKALAMKFFGWSNQGMEGLVSEQDKSTQLFHAVVADEYELEIDIEATNKGLRLFEITRMQYLEKVAQAVADALNK